MKERLDILLVKKGYYQSRERAKAAIMAGIVYVDGQRSDKAGNQVDTEAEIFVKENLCPYVSRGGLKLEKSMGHFNLQLNGAVCMDIGASTGGFTDCMLQNGASRTGPGGSTPSMWAMDSWTGNFEMTRESSIWKNVTSAIWIPI